MSNTVHMHEVLHDTTCIMPSTEAFQAGGIAYGYIRDVPLPQGGGSHTGTVRIFRVSSPYGYTRIPPMLQLLRHSITLLLIRSRLCIARPRAGERAGKGGG